MSAVNPPIRPEFELASRPARDAVRNLPVARRRWSGHALRRAAIVIGLVILWAFAARLADNDLLLPTPGEVARAFVADIASGELVARTAISLALLLKGYALGVAAAFALTALAVSTRFGRDLLSTLTSMFNPLPAIALLPLAMLWFGLGQVSLIFVLVHSVLWPLALNLSAGFSAVPETLRMAGRNYGLRGVRLTAFILVPSALPAILSGLRVGWAFAWRTLIAAELFFGASSGRGGLGWYIFQNRNELYTDRVFAGLITVIAIGMLVENLVFESIERVTIRRWGIDH